MCCRLLISWPCAGRRRQRGSAVGACGAHWRNSYGSSRSRCRFRTWYATSVDSTALVKSDSLPQRFGKSPTFSGSAAAQSVIRSVLGELSSFTGTACRKWLRCSRRWHPTIDTIRRPAFSSIKSPKRVVFQIAEIVNWYGRIDPIELRIGNRASVACGACLDFDSAAIIRTVFCKVCTYILQCAGLLGHCPPTCWTRGCAS